MEPFLLTIYLLVDQNTQCFNLILGGFVWVSGVSWPPEHLPRPCLAPTPPADRPAGSQPGLPHPLCPPPSPLFGPSLSLTVRCADPWGLTNACKLLGCSRFGYGMGLGWYGMVWYGRESVVETEGQGKWAIAQPYRIVGHSRPRPFAFVTFCGPASKVWQSNVVSTPPFGVYQSKSIRCTHTQTETNTRSTLVSSGTCWNTLRIWK